MIKTKVLALGLSGAFLALLLLAWIFQTCTPVPGPKIPPATQRSMDSLAVTRPTFDSTARAGQRAVARDTTVATTQRALATRAEASARFAHVTADSLASSAVQEQRADSAATAWREAYEARTRESDAWHAVAMRNDSAYRAERDARIVLAGLYASDTLRRVAVEKVNDGLVLAIARLEAPCTIPGTFGRVRCPSRTVTGLVEGAGGVLLGHWLASK